MSIIERIETAKGFAGVLYPAALFVPAYLFPRITWCDFPVPFEPGEEFVYSPQARPRRMAFRLSLSPGSGARRHALDILPGSEIGRSGQMMLVEQLFTFLDIHGRTLDAVLLYYLPDETAEEGVELLLPLSPVIPRMEYVLIETSPPADAHARILDAAAQLLPTGFARGTRIRRGDGVPVPIERLAPGDSLATADGERVRLLDIQRHVMPGWGAAAPVFLQRGTLSNNRDLALSPWHRVFIRDWRIGRGQRESDVLALAGDLAEVGIGWRVQGGMVEYFALETDRPALITADGLTVEAMPSHGNLHLGSGANRRQIRSLSSQELRTYAQTVLPGLGIF